MHKNAKMVSRRICISRLNSAQTAVTQGLLIFISQPSRYHSTNILGKDVIRNIPKLPQNWNMSEGSDQ